MKTIFRGDDTGAFDKTLLRIDLYNPKNKVVSKAEFRCGTVFKSIDNPVFPLKINLDSEETAKLRYETQGFLAIYDDQSRKKTLEGYVVFNVKGKVV